MRIVCMASFRNVAGAPEALVRLARLLRGRGHEVEVWFLYAKAAAFPDEPGVRVLMDRHAPGPLDYLRIAGRVRRALRSHPPDAVISFLPLANVLGQVAAWSVGVPVRVASQRTPSETYGRFMRALDALVGSLGAYTANVAVSRAVLDSFGRHPAAYRMRMQVVYNGIVWAPSALSREEARRRLGLPTDVPLLVSVGRHEPQKNFLYLLEIMPSVSDAHLAIAGDGALRPEFERRAAALGLSGRVHLLGNLPRPAVPDLLRAGDVFVQPSLFEGQSNALLEAMNEGLAIVASDVPSQAETLTEPDGGTAGVLLPLSDRQGWIDALGALLRSPGARAELGARARRLAATYTPERIAASFERILLPAPGGAGGTGSVPAAPPVGQEPLRAHRR